MRAKVLIDGLGEVLLLLLDPLGDGKVLPLVQGDPPFFGQLLKCSFAAGNDGSETIKGSCDDAAQHIYEYYNLSRSIAMWKM